MQFNGTPGPIARPRDNPQFKANSTSRLTFAVLQERNVTSFCYTPEDYQQIIALQRSSGTAEEDDGVAVWVFAVIAVGATFAVHSAGLCTAVLHCRWCQLAHRDYVAAATHLCAAQKAKLLTHAKCACY